MYKDIAQKIALEKDEKALLKYLRDKIKDGHKFFQSHKIARDLGLSSKFIGTILYKFSLLNDTRLKITQYARSNSRWTWMIEEEQK